MTLVDIDALWAQVQPDARGLVPCIAQDLRTRAMLMVAWVSKEALARSLETGYATYYSRSRQALWEKGAVSGNRQRLVHVRLDCDGDTLLYLVEATLPACHEGTDTCFSWRRIQSRWERDPVDVAASVDSRVIEDLETVLDARVQAAGEQKPSYTRSLLEGGIERQAGKLREESEELIQALANEPDDRVVAEAADLLYHIAVALKGRRLSFRRVLGELDARMGVSGVDEKAARARRDATAPLPADDPPG